MSARRLRAPATSAICAAVVVLSSLGLPHAADAVGQPDLKVTGLEMTQRHVAAGGTLIVDETTKNVGPTRAGRSSTGYWLSKDTIKSAKDRSLSSRKVPRLRPGRLSAVTSDLAVPSSTPAGRWHLIACADVKSAVQEQSERNNCRATTSRVTVDAGVSGAVDFPQTPHPMKVTPTLGTPAAPVPVSPDSATTATVTGPDGTTYDLAVPADAVDQTTSITMTPLTALAGAPMSSLIGGVRIEPTGLLLNDDAVLTITPASVPSRSTATGFRFFDGGVEAAMYPLAPVGADPGSISLDVASLATYAVGNSSDTDRAKALGHPPTLVSGQFDNIIAPLVRAQQLGRSASRAADTSLLAADSENYYQQVIKPNLDKALAGDPKAPIYTADALAFVRQQAVLGGSDTHEADVFSAILAILAKEVDEEYQRCTNEHSMPDLGRLLADARVYAVLGADADSSNVFEKYRACGQFDVMWTAHTTRSQEYTQDADHYTENASWDMTTGVPLHLTANATGSFDGGGPLQHGSFSYSASSTGTCDIPKGTWTDHTSITATADGRYAAQLVLDLQPQSFYVGPGIPPITVGQDPFVRAGAQSVPTETYTTTKTGCISGSHSATGERWYFTHSVAHVPFPVLPDAPQDGAVLIDRTFDFDNGGAGDISAPHVTDTTTVKVTHVPQ